MIYALNESKEILMKIASYKAVELDIKEIDFKIEENEEKNISESDENIKLILEKKKLQRKINRIENAMNILTDEEKEIIKIVHIERKRYINVQDKLRLSYQRIKQLEKQGKI